MKHSSEHLRLLKVKQLVSYFNKVSIEASPKIDFLDLVYPDPHLKWSITHLSCLRLLRSVLPETIKVRSHRQRVSFFRPKFEPIIHFLVFLYLMIDAQIVYIFDGDQSPSKK